MARLKIIYDRNGCIGADMCTFTDSKHFEMQPDRKVNLKGGREIEPGSGLYGLELEAFDQDAINAGQSCPAGVITVIDLQTGKRLAGQPIESEGVRKAAVEAKRAQEQKGEQK